MSHKSSISKVLHTFKMDDQLSTKTPARKYIKLSREDCREKGQKAKFPYRELVGSLLYACTTRPDIQFAVSHPALL